jgi:hypothetical protein
MFSVEELCRPILARATMNHETYKMLYMQCVEHIKRKHEAGCTITLFHVPEFVFGRPPFTQSHAIRYVAEKLRRGRFDVKVDGPVLHVDWEARIRAVCRKIKAKEAKARKKKAKATKKRAKQRVAKDEPLSVRLERLLKKNAPAR